MCSPFSRIVVTGSGLVSLLNSFRTARVNGFALWDAITFVSVGSAPSNAASLDMASRLLEPYAAFWPQEARKGITPSRLVGKLLHSSSTTSTSSSALVSPPFPDPSMPSAAATAPSTPPGLPDSGFGELFSARPALMAYALGCMGNASTGTWSEVLGEALDAVRGKLKHESLRDTIPALESLDRLERRVLRDVADRRYTCAELTAIRKGERHFKAYWDDEHVPARARSPDTSDLPPGSMGVIISSQPGKLAALIDCLREKAASESADAVVRLQPPYEALLRSCTSRDGALAVSMHDSKIYLDFTTHSNLNLIADHRRGVEEGVWGKVATAFWASMISNGIGFRKASKTGLRAPQSSQEFCQVPALAGLENMLSATYVAAKHAKAEELKKKQQAGEANHHISVHVPSEPTLRKFLRSEVAVGKSFEVRLGRELILALRHFQAHIWGEAPALVQNGLTAAVVKDAVDAIVPVLAAGDRGGPFAIDPARPKQLILRGLLVTATGVATLDGQTGPYTTNGGVEGNSTDAIKRRKTAATAGQTKSTRAGPASRR